MSVSYARSATMSRSRDRRATELAAQNVFARSTLDGLSTGRLVGGGRDGNDRRSGPPSYTDCVSITRSTTSMASARAAARPRDKSAEPVAQYSVSTRFGCVVSRADARRTASSE